MLTDELAHRHQTNNNEFLKQKFWGEMMLGFVLPLIIPLLGNVGYVASHKWELWLFLSSNLQLSSTCNSFFSPKLIIGSPSLCSPLNIYLVCFSDLGDFFVLENFLFGGGAHLLLL